MFNKLRNSFLLVNMLLTSLVMLAAFITVYVAIYQNTFETQYQRLEDLISQVVPLMDAVPAAGTVDAPQNGSDVLGQASSALGTGQGSLEAHIPFLILEFDSEGRVIDFTANVALPQDELDQAAEAWTGDGDCTGQLTIDGATWLYEAVGAYEGAVVSIGDRSVLPGVGDGVMKAPPPYASHSYLAFIDISQSTDLLRELLVIFVAVAVAMLAAIFLISLLFANRSIKPIKDAWEQQRQFIADASHELKTPLAIMHVNYDAVVDDPTQTVASQMKWLDYLRVGMGRMEDLVSKLLLLDKANEDTSSLAQEPVDLKALVQWEALPYANLAANKSLSLVFDAEKTEPHLVVSDPARISQILEVLFENAVKYTPPYGSITVTLTRDVDDVACIEVTNTGEGIAAADLPHVFDRFYRADQARAGDAVGFGLGLSIAQKTAQRINATLTAQSTPNQSTTFTLRFHPE
ncbi:MAG: HAMP domain-containing histidine kinase [Coriobacteriales bacterium]|jgi:signal transduction histidine kinase|nr:HAMP domain-containing histidine kinase [Coriobacteriales bacterium]